MIRKEQLQVLLLCVTGSLLDLASSVISIAALSSLLSGQWMLFILAVESLLKPFGCEMYVLTTFFENKNVKTSNFPSLQSSYGDPYTRWWVAVWLGMGFTYNNDCAGTHRVWLWPHMSVHFSRISAVDG